MCARRRRRCWQRRTDGRLGRGALLIRSKVVEFRGDSSLACRRDWLAQPPTAPHAYRKEVAVVLRVQPAKRIERKRGVGGTNRKIGEELEFGRREDPTVPLVEHVDVAVLALHVDVAPTVNGGRVDAPLEAIGVPAVISTDERAAW